MNKDRCSVIIIHWQSAQSLLKLVETLAPYTHGDVVVVDNASLSSSDQARLSMYPCVVTKLASNRGFAGAANYGAALSQSEWLLFLNPDVEISPDVIHNWIDWAEENKADVSVPAWSNPAYTKPVPSLLSLWQEFTPLGRLGARHTSHITLAGACLLIKRSIFERLGGWDERFFVWFEDSDLSKRLYQLPAEVAIYPTKEIKHAGGESFQQIQETVRRELFFGAMQCYVQKHFSRFAQLLMKPVIRTYASTSLLPVDSAIRASVVVPNLRADLLETFLEKNLHTFTSVDELIVVTMLPDVMSWRARFPTVIFINLEQNRGFADTVNIGLRRARGMFLGTVNDDTILPPRWLDVLCDSFEANTGSVSPVLVKPNGQIESAGVWVLPQGKAVTKQPEPGEAPDAVASFNGAAVLFKREALKQVGLFDTKFGSYLEDIDLGLRLHRVGWANNVVDAVSVTHLGQQTSQKWPIAKRWWDVRNWWYVVLKNFSLRHWLRYGVPILVERGRNISGLIKVLV